MRGVEAWGERCIGEMGGGMRGVGVGGGARVAMEMKWMLPSCRFWGVNTWTKDAQILLHGSHVTVFKGQNMID